MEKSPNKNDIRKIAGAIKRSKKKVITLDALSRLVGLYPDVLGDKISYFAPMIMLDPSINCRDFLPEMEAYCEEKPEGKKEKESVKRVVVKNTELLDYRSISDFVYRKFTSVGGLIDPSYIMTDEDLVILRKLVDNEIRKRKSPEAKKTKKRP